MKILIVSDNHGKLKNMNIIEQREYDKLIHLGDSQFSHDFISNKGYESVGGNCDHDLNYDSEKVLTYHNKKIFLTHGHLRNIRNVFDLEQNNELQDFDVVLFGHLHIPYVNIVDETIFLSPGSIEYPRGKYPHASFAELIITENKIKTEHFSIINGEIKRMNI